METLPQPRIFREGQISVVDFLDWKRTVSIWSEHDIFQIQLEEYFEITHPELVGTHEYATLCQSFVKKRLAGTNGELKGNWIYYPWSGRLVHTLPEQEYETLRTNRNRHLITTEEQQLLSRTPVGLIGLSVGSNVATALAYGGIAGVLKLGEFDILATSNLNRIRARLDQIGMSKISITAEQVYEINPYATIIPYAGGMTKESLVDFVTGTPTPRVIFEIIDHFEMKIHIRTLARQARIPVVMITNLGDRVLIDVERYDLDPNTPFFNGRAGAVPDDMVKYPDITTADKHRYAVALAGVEHIPERALASVADIGKTLVGRPQLASAVTVAGGLCSYIARKIVLGESLPSCSWLIDFDILFGAKTALT